MSCNVCMCGAQAGYPHKAHCAYPLYRGSEKQEAAWEAASNKLAAEIAAWEAEQERQRKAFEEGMVSGLLGDD